MRRLVAMLVSLTALLGLAAPARAQSAVSLADVGVTYSFGEQITFSARVQSAAPVQQAALFFQVENDPSTRTVQLSVQSNGNADFVYLLQGQAIRPFARVFFWYHVVLTDNTVFDSPHYFFQYDDNRFPWQVIDQSGLRLHWYAGDMAFGQSAFNSALLGYQSFQALFPLQPGPTLNIYVYASATDVQDTLNLGGYSWVGGHASPDLGVVLVSIAPGDTQEAEMARQIPHELAHVLLYRSIGAAYTNLPIWLQEGVASVLEPVPNPDYAQVLNAAAQKNSLLPLNSLCGPFPVDASGAILAYAEADSFTRYIQKNYGDPGLQALVQAYASGLPCEQGTTRALGVPLSQLDTEWRQVSLGQQTAGSTFQNLLPYLVLFLVLLIVPAWKLGAMLLKRGGA